MPSQLPTAQFQRRVLVAAGIIVALVVVLYFLWQAVYVLLLAFAGTLLAVLLHTLAAGVRTVVRMPEQASLWIVIVALVAGLALGIGVSAGAISQQTEQLSERIPDALESLEQRLRQYAWGRWLIGQSDADELPRQAPRALLRSDGLLSSVSSAGVAIVVVAFIGIYLATEPRLYTDGLLRLLPKNRRRHGAEILGAINYTLRWWIIGQGVTMLVIGLLTWLGLWTLGIPLAFLLGLLAAAFNFVPNFGPLVSFIPAILLALAISPTKALWVAGLYLVAQTFEGYILTPLVQRRAVLLPPALTILAQVLLGVTVGALGVMLAAPLTAAVLVIVKMLYVEEVLGDEGVGVPNHQQTGRDRPPLPAEKRPE